MYQFCLPIIVVYVINKVSLPFIMPTQHIQNNSVELRHPDPHNADKCVIIIHADMNDGCLVEGKKLDIKIKVDDNLKMQHLWDYLIDCDQREHKGSLNIPLNDEYQTLSYEIWAGLFLALTRFFLVKELGFIPQAD